MAQWSVDVAVAADPYYVPRHSNWAGDVDGVVAIVTPSAAPPLVVKERGAGYVVAVCGGGVAVVGVYFSPNRLMVEFESFLLRLSSAVRRLAPANILVMGDLNAKSPAWGSRLPNAKGRAVHAWVTANGLVVANRGTANTCVRRWGGSIVDITFATPTLASQVQDWRVLEGEETLSDHVYIRFRVSSSQASTTAPARRGRGREGFPRWALAKFDAERATEAAIVAAWGFPPSGFERDGSRVQKESDCHLRCRNAPYRRQASQQEGGLLVDARARASAIRQQRRAEGAQAVSQKASHAPGGGNPPRRLQGGARGAPSRHKPGPRSGPAGVPSHVGWGPLGAPVQDGAQQVAAPGAPRRDDGDGAPQSSGGWPVPGGG
ncbi:uncharacterized protein LOC113234205 [Hyposmocoma kahamanoa]|uniref:uncharacterized protein LOC113234205 n=1 Tax=Hyposmocoma kahamanoa TaxID=1477025 RepID=UPI000E6D9592|nr:uncharacterized protein LOC113234205 [Hyposmocoma kahamanoa]